MSHMPARTHTNQPGREVLRSGPHPSTASDNVSSYVGRRPGSRSATRAQVIQCCVISPHFVGWASNNSRQPCIADRRCQLDQVASKQHIQPGNLHVDLVAVQLCDSQCGFRRLCICAGDDRDDGCQLRIERVRTRSGHRSSSGRRSHPAAPIAAKPSRNPRGAVVTAGWAPARFSQATTCSRTAC